MIIPLVINIFLISINISHAGYYKIHLDNVPSTDSTLPNIIVNSAEKPEFKHTQIRDTSSYIVVVHPSLYKINRNSLESEIRVPISHHQHDIKTVHVASQPKARDFNTYYERSDIPIDFYNVHEPRIKVSFGAPATTTTTTTYTTATAFSKHNSRRNFFRNVYNNYW